MPVGILPDRSKVISPAIVALMPIAATITPGKSLGIYNPKSFCHMPYAVIMHPAARIYFAARAGIIDLLMMEDKNTPPIKYIPEGSGNRVASPPKNPVSV